MTENTSITKVLSSIGKYCGNDVEGVFTVSSFNYDTFNTDEVSVSARKDQ